MYAGTIVRGGIADAGVCGVDVPIREQRTHGGVATSRDRQAVLENFLDEVSRGLSNILSCMRVRVFDKQSVPTEFCDKHSIATRPCRDIVDTCLNNSPFFGTAHILGL